MRRLYLVFDTVVGSVQVFQQGQKWVTLKFKVSFKLVFVLQLNPLSYIE